MTIIEAFNNLVWLSEQECVKLTKKEHLAIEQALGILKELIEKGVENGKNILLSEQLEN